MSKIKLTRTYEVEVEQSELDNIHAFGGSRQEALIAATQAADVGNLSGEIVMCYGVNEDGSGEYYYIDDASSSEVIVARLAYRVTAVYNVVN